MDFNWVDWVIIFVIVTSSLISLSKGFVKELLSLVIWMGAVVISWKYSGLMSSYLMEYIKTSSSIRTIISGAIVFIICIIIGSFISLILSKLIKISGMSSTDRILGMVFGAGRGTALIVFIVGLLSLLPVKKDLWWNQSKLIPDFLIVADWSKEVISNF